MAAQEQESQNSSFPADTDTHCSKLLSSYIGFSFSIFLGFLPKNSIPLLSRLQNENKHLSFKLMQAEEQLNQLHCRRREDSKANARVVEIFASHRHAWQKEEKRLLQQIDECNEEMAYLKSKIEDFERVEGELRGSIEDLKREILERDEMLNFMSRNNCETVSGAGVHELGSDFLSSAAWSDKARDFQDIQYESVHQLYHMKHFVSRKESPWMVDNGVSSKLKLLEQGLERVPSPIRKQGKRYQALAGKIDDLCRRMQACDPCESTLSSEFRIQRQTEFLLEAFRLQQHASETSQKLTALQIDAGKCYDGGELEISERRSLDCIRNNFKEIQRNLEIWVARIIGDLEGILARDGASQYFVSRYDIGQ